MTNERVVLGVGPILITGYNYTIWSRWSLVVISGQAEEDDVTLASVRSDQVSVVGGLTCLFLFLNHVSITIILMIIIFHRIYRLSHKSQRPKLSWENEKKEFF